MAGGRLHQEHIEEGLIVPMLDARRLEVYSAIFDANYNEVRAIEAQILDETSFEDELEKNKIYFIGNGVEKTKTLINNENTFIFISIFCY